MSDTPGYKTFCITQQIKELTKKLTRLVKDSADAVSTSLRIENLKRDLDS